MSDQRLTQLTEATVVSGSDIMYVVQGGQSMQAFVATVLAALNKFTNDIDSQGHVLRNFLLRGAIDEAYDLSTDAENINNSGVIQLVDSRNVYVHGNLAETVEVRFPVVGAGAACPFGVISFKLGTGGVVNLTDTETWRWEKASADEPDPEISTVGDTVIRLRYAYDRALGAYAVAYSEIEPV